MLLLHVAEPLEVTTAPVRSGDRPWYTIRPAASSTGDRPGRALADGAAQPRTTRLDVPPGGPPNADNLFLANGARFVHALKRYEDAARRSGSASAVKVVGPNARDRLLQHPALPRRLGYTPGCDEQFVPLEEQLAQLGARRRLRVAILSIFHHRYGDAVMSLPLFRELRSRLAARVGSIEIDLLRQEPNADTERLFLRSGYVDGIRGLPMSLARFAGYDAYVDFTRRALPAGVPWIDALLERIAVDPTSVPLERKRSWLPPDYLEIGRRRHGARLTNMRGDGAPVLLLHPIARTPDRSMPSTVATAWITAVLERTDWLVASVAAPPVRHPRVLDWSALWAGFDDFVYLVSQVDAFVSVDTCLYHVADAFDVPGVVLFTTLDPASWIAYYPSTTGVAVPRRAGDAPLHGKGRGFADEAAGPWGWDRVDVDPLIAVLRRALDQRRGAR
jgi:hypothetical protein